MHEGHFTEQIVETILEELEKRQVSHPSKIKVKVGEMLHLVPESVKMHFQVMTVRTMLEHAELELEEIPVIVKCRRCGAEGGVLDHHMLMCQYCDSQDVHLVSGHDVVIDEIVCEQKIK